MRRRTLLLLLLMLSCGVINVAGETVEGSAPAVSGAPAASPDGGAPSGEREVIRRLSGTRWTLELRPMFGQKSEPPVTDTLRFSGNEMTSERFSAGGFASSAISITVGEDGVPVWEATQLNPSEGIALWHGELHEHTINGTVSTCPLTGATEDFIFVGQEAPAATAPSAPPESSAPPVAPAPAEPAPAPEQKE